MINLFKVERLRPTKTRKIPFLPRLGFVVELGGRRFSYRQVPLIETILNLMERGPSFSNLQKIVLEQLYEVNLPSRSSKKTVNVRAKTVASRQKKIRGVL